MTDCGSVRQLILEAEPDELRGIGNGAVAAHVRECGACARLARRILEETAALDRYLGTEADGAAVVDILRRAGVAGTAPAGTPLRRRRAWVRPSAWVALAAAASVTLLLVTRDRTSGPAPVAIAVAEPPPLVQASPDRTVAVMQTDNPDITVLWFFQGGDR